MGLGCNRLNQDSLAILSETFIHIDAPHGLGVALRGEAHGLHVALPGEKLIRSDALHGLSVALRAEAHGLRVAIPGEAHGLRVAIPGEKLIRSNALHGLRVPCGFSAALLGAELLGIGTVLLSIGEAFINRN